MHSLEELEGFNSSTPRYEEDSLCLCLEGYTSPVNFSRNFQIAERMPESG
ncbi:hypothetical protein Gotur_025516 [Gossypium turneri]